MKKTKKTQTKRISTQPKSHSGVALLVCFLIAVIAVAIAMRQLILERRFRTETSNTIISTNPLVGSYSVTVPESKSKGRIITLKLDDKRNAVLTQDYQDVTEPIMQKGSWSGDSNGTVITTFGDTTYAFSYSTTPKPSLRLLNPDVKLWGAATLTLVKE